MSRPVDLVIFDLDGVITTEKIYWDCARLTLWELLQAGQGSSGLMVPEAEARDNILPLPLIEAVKARSVNSNWDLTYLGGCALLLGCQPAGGQSCRSIPELLDMFRSTFTGGQHWPRLLQDLLEVAETRQGSALLAFAGKVAADYLGAQPELLHPQGPWWHYLFGRFQEWRSGEALIRVGLPPLAETLTLPGETLQRALFCLREAGYRLGIATGRPRNEAFPPLEANGLLGIFDPDRLVTYTEIEAAQQATGRSHLGKPHPFSILRAIHLEASVEHLLDEPPSDGLRALMVGDSPSDAQAAKAAGIPCLGILSGAADPRQQNLRRAALLAAGCVDVLADVSHVPDWLQTWRN